jgi:hypothetical protein
LFAGQQTASSQAEQTHKFVTQIKSQIQQHTIHQRQEIKKAEILTINHVQLTLARQRTHLFLGILDSLKMVLLKMEPQSFLQQEQTHIHPCLVLVFAEPIILTIMRIHIMPHLQEQFLAVETQRRYIIVPLVETHLLDHAQQLPVRRQVATLPAATLPALVPSNLALRVELPV